MGVGGLMIMSIRSVGMIVTIVKIVMIMSIMSIMSIESRMMKNLVRVVLLVVVEIVVVASMMTADGASRDSRCRNSGSEVRTGGRQTGGGGKRGEIACKEKSKCCVQAPKNIRNGHDFVSLVLYLYLYKVYI